MLCDTKETLHPWVKRLWLILEQLQDQFRDWRAAILLQHISRWFTSKKNTFKVSLILHGCVHHFENSPSTNGFLFQEISQRSRFTVLTAYFPFYTPPPPPCPFLKLQWHVFSRASNKTVGAGTNGSWNEMWFGGFADFTAPGSSMSAAISSPAVINKTHLIGKECSKINGWISWQLNWKDEL